MAEVAAASSSTGLPNSKMTVVDVLDEPVSDDEVIYIYRWLDSLEFSKSRKTSCNRDFADGVMMSELIALYIPKIINSTYCVPSYATSRKIANWDHLNKKVFRRIRFQLTTEIIKDLATARPGMIERVLRKLQPILFLGSKAVVAPSRKLENIKSRFMDFEKTYLKEVDKEKAKVEETFTSPRPQSRQQSISKTDGYRNRARTQSRAKGASIPHAPPPTATLELKVLKNPTPRSSRLPTKLPAIATKPQTSSRPQSAMISKSSTEPPMITIHNPNDLGVHTGENYDIFTRPSTGRSSNDGVPSPSEILAEVNNLKTRMDHDAAQLEKDKLIDMDGDEETNLDEDSELPELPVVRSSWLPVEDGDVPLQFQADTKPGGDKAKGTAGAASAAVVEEGEYSDTDSNSQLSEDINKLGEIHIENQTSDKTNDNNNNPSDTAPDKLPENREDPADAEQEADDNTFCDQTGYDEDTEDGEDDAEATDGEDSDGDTETRPSRESRKKRKMKRVVKYEYREEYVLNGMAAFKLPNSAQLEKLKNDYINKGNKDPNCRGYGFV